MKKQLSILLMLILCFLNGLAQQQASLTENLSKLQQERPLEKLYLSFDKPYYAAGDTLWYKAFLLNEAFGPSEISDKIHIELYNDSLKLVTQRVTMLNNGLGYGDIVLDGRLADGTYTLRAYTSWQQNFGEEHFFQVSFNIGKGNDKTWLVELVQKRETIDGKKNVSVNVKLQSIRNEVAGFKDLEVSLYNGNKRLMSNRISTKSDGTFETKIPVPNNPGSDYRMLIVDKTDALRRAMVPLQLSDSLVTDLQFMPEGGYLVRGILNKVGFKAVGQDGLGKRVSGKIVNSNNEVQAAFADAHNGMGNFSLLPARGERYFAVYMSDGVEQRTEIKNIKEEGTTLKVDVLTKKDSIVIAVRASENRRSEKNYQLLAQGGGKIITAFKLSLKNGFFNVKLPANNFPGGIVNFTLLSPEDAPLNERLVYIKESKSIALDIKTQKNNFSLRDSVALEVTAVDENNKPVQGAFSITVTNDEQVKQPKSSNNIKSYYLLKSNLRGNVENGAWYFRNNIPATLNALDNLLLTQAWVGYKWENVQKNEAIKFKPEKNNVISGRIYGLMKVPSVNMKVTLMSLGKNFFATDTITNDKGMFTFSELPIIDTPEFVIKIKTAKGKKTDNTIIVNEFTPAPPIIFSPFLPPWYFNPDSVNFSNYNNALVRENIFDKQQKKLSGIAIEQVNIRNLNPKIVSQVAWDANFRAEIDEDELKKTPRKTLYDLLKDRFPGLRINTLWTDQCAGKLKQHTFQNYTFGNDLLASIRIDGMSTLLASIGRKDVYNETGVSLTASLPEPFFTNQYLLNSINAEDVKNIKLYKGCAYYFLEIESRSGQGPFLELAKGVYVHKPLPIYAGKEFYSPKYLAGSKADGTDQRSTIFWDANVVTDADGKAKLNFYTGDVFGNYSVKIEGTDLQGRFGVGSGKIKVSAGRPASK